MNRLTKALGLAAPLAIAALPLASTAQAQGPRHFRHEAALNDNAAGDRPLTIGGRHRYGPIIYKKDEIIAPGGFSAHGYGYGDPGSEGARRAYQNADVRARTNGVYGYGLDGLGGTHLFGDRGESGYDNPSWGNAFNTYTGFNGTPTALAFGPAYAGRYIADHEPEFDNHDSDWPSPQDLGYQRVPRNADEE